MRREILMPPVTPSMTDGRIARWHVAEGQAVAAGDVLVEIATTTATLEIEASGGGRVERILVPAGTEGVKVNTPIAILFGEAGGAVVDEGPRADMPLAFAALDVGRRPRAPVSAQAETAVEGRSITVREALRDGIAEEMRRDPSVILIGVDVAQNRGALKVAQGLIDEFGPARVVAAPALEDALYGMALGAALGGLKPIVEVGSWSRALDTLRPYLARAAEMFALSGGTQPVPLVVRGANGFSPGMTGEDTRCVAAELAQMPGLKVAMPADAQSAKGLLRAAVRDPGPVALLEHELLYPVRGPVESGDGAALLGHSRIGRAGRDVTVVAIGRAVQTALEAAAQLSGDGIEAEVIDLMCVRPLDRDGVAASLARTGRLVTVEEGGPDLGVGAEIIAAMAETAFRHFKAPPARVCGAGGPMPYAAGLQEAALPKSDDVVRIATAAVRRG
jgi:pyruvate dehydrogenase E1 component beta subunit